MANGSSTNSSSTEDRVLSDSIRRDNLLNTLYRVACIVAIPVVFAWVRQPSHILIKSVFLAAYALLVLFTFIKLPYWIRAAVMLAAMYAMGLSNSLEPGIGVNAYLFFIVFVALSVLFFSKNAGIVAEIISIVSITYISWPTLSAQFSALNPQANDGTVFAWISQTFIFFMVSTILAIGIDTSIHGYANALRDEEQYLKSRINEHASLEEQVNKNSLTSSRRSEQLEAAAFVNRAIAEAHSLEELLNIVVQQISIRFGFYHSGVFLLDQNQSQLALVAASSEAGQNMLTRGHYVGIDRNSLVGSAAHLKSPRFAQNEGADAKFFNTLELPETRSEIALPMLYQNHLIGVLDIQSSRNDVFTPDEITTLQSMTDQIALAIENNRLIEQSRSVISTLESINAENVSKAWKERLGDQIKGYSYTPIGINIINSLDYVDKINSTPDKTVNIPLILRGKEIGEITLTRKPSDSSWGDTEKEMAQRVATQVALAIENARLLEDSLRRATREKTVNELSSLFNRSLDVDTLLQNAVRELHKLPQVSEVSVFINPPEEFIKSN